MVHLSEIVAHLDAYLATDRVRDYPGALNGLQLENSGAITRVVAAVDASLPVIEQASSIPGTLLLVHHGIFWQGAQTFTHHRYRKIKTAIENDLAIYSSHLPLDFHPISGNNILLAQAIGIQNPQPLPADPKSGQSMGLIGDWSGNLQRLLAATSRAVHANIHHCPAGPAEISKVAVITGGAGSEVECIARTGAHAFITGEGPHWSYPLAEELEIHLIYAGHYATETFGVQHLAQKLANEFQLDHDFIDRPTGL